MSDENPTNPAAHPAASRPLTYEERFRLYVDESGDHVFNHLDNPSHRYLCLLGCWFKNPDYEAFHRGLESVKQEILEPHPDEPVIMHREDIINRRGIFHKLRDEAKSREFDERLLAVIAAAQFRIVAVVIDKKALREKYGDAAAHPYHLAIGYLLQRYCGYLNHVNRCGDVMAESRGGREDRLLKESYADVYANGVWMTRAEHFQHALTSKELKIKPKSANISGLQLADLLGHPCRHDILMEFGHTTDAGGPFAVRLLEAVRGKFNAHLYDGRIKGYGKVLYPEK